MDIKIIVAAHKPYWMPEDPVYMPIHVGSAGKESIGFTRDDTGENISDKNPRFCELTGIYWAWKNLKADYIGLVHYRRYFAGKGKSDDRRARILSGRKLEELLGQCDVVVPKKRNYWIETNYSQYAHAHHIGDLDTTRRIIAERCPEYLPAFDASMKRTTGHRFNMFVMKYDCFCRYCSWLFDILEEAEKRIDVSGYDTYNARVFGFLAERLLDVWLETEQIAYREVPVINLEKEDWIKKGSAFLMRKFSGGTDGQRKK